MDPVFKEHGKWYFWDETWSDTKGPFETQKEALEAMELYCKELNYKKED